MRREETENLRDGSMRKHDPKDYLTKMTSVAPDSNCPTPTWDAHLNMIFPDDAEMVTSGAKMVAYFHRSGGYCLTGDASEDALFFWHGEGGRGKTTTIGVLRSIWGDYAKEAPMEMFMMKRHGHDHPTELTILHGTRLVTASENDEGSRWSEARVKKLTGGGQIQARKMRKDFYTFDLTHKLMIEGNHRPRLSSVGEQWRRRLHMIPFNVPIPNVDIHFDEKLLREAPGILSKFIAGCIEWQRIGLNPPQLIVDATNKYLSEQDVIKEWFEECVDVGPDAPGAFTPLLYDSYHAFTKLRGEFPLGQTTFADKLESRAAEFGIKREEKAFYIGKDDPNTGEKKKRGRGFKGIEAVRIPAARF